MGYICKLIRGSLSLDLGASPYALAEGFAPPAVQEVASIATGTSANRYGGGRKIDSRLAPRDYVFTLIVSGSSNAQCELAVDRLDSFLRSGTDADPVYFSWKADNNVARDPLWGQFGAARRAKVLFGHAEKSGEYYLAADTRNKKIWMEVMLTINPVEGLMQLAGEATGAIMENDMFSPDGISRGLMIPEATANYITNPIFSNTTWNNDWTAGANIVASQNLDKDFVYPGATCSAKLTRIGASTIQFTQSPTLPLGNYTHSAYVKKEDGTAATVNDIKIFFDSAQTSTYTAMGNGITRVHYSGSATAAAHTIGVEIEAVGATIYLLGFQTEAKAYPTPLCWGDTIGRAWDGDKGLSVTIRAAARYRVATADCLNIAEGTIVLVWMPDKANTALAADIWLFEEANEFQARFDNDDEKFYFTDGTNTISSSATTFAANTPMVLHYVWENGSLKIYRAGVEIATGSTYTPHAFGTDLYLGTDESAANHCNGTFLGFHTYKYALSATEIANDYTNIWQHVNGGDGFGQCLESIPWEYDFDGDGVLDAYCDATHHDWMIIGGVSGSLPAQTSIVTTNSVDNRSLIISCHQSPIFHNPSDYFSDKSGSGDATALGTAVVTVASVNTTAVLGAAVTVPANFLEDLKEYPVRIWASLDDAGANLTIAPRVELTTSTVGHTGDYRPITTSATLKIFCTYDVSNIPDISKDPIFRYFSGGGITSVMDTEDCEIWLKRSVSGAANVTIDYLRALFGSWTYIFNDVSANSDKIAVGGKRAIIQDGTSNVIAKKTEIQGDIFEVHPHTLNHIVILTGDLGSDNVLAATTTIDSIYITPRWALA